MSFQLDILRDVNRSVDRNRRLLQSIPQNGRKPPQPKKPGKKQRGKKPQKKRQQADGAYKRPIKREKTMRNQMKSHWECMGAKLEKKAVQLETVFSEGEECAICMDDLTRKCNVKTTCLHTFHQKCLEEWVEKSKICPFCRSEIK
jgi:Ring finger domain